MGAREVNGYAGEGLAGAGGGKLGAGDEREWPNIIDLLILMEFLRCP